jgi:hypothetical protein
MAGELRPGVRIVPLARASELRGRLEALFADPGGLIELLRPILLSRTVPNAYRYLPSLTAYLKAERPDALITAFPFENLLGIAARQLAGVDTRVIVTERNATTRSTHQGVKWKRRYLPPLLRRQYQKADAVVAVSNGVADGLAALTAPPRRRITTIYNPVVSQAMLAKAAEPTPHPWLAPGQPPVVFGVGPGSAEAHAELLALAAALGCAEDTDLPGLTLNPFAYQAQ